MLERIFKGSDWPDWRRALANLDAKGPEFATWPTPNSVRFGPLVKQRAIAIPLAPWLDDVVRSGGVPVGVPLQDDDFSGEFG